MFEGIRGNTHTGDIALDDVSFTAGMANCIVQPSDALPSGMSEWQFFVLIVLMILF